VGINIWYTQGKKRRDTSSMELNFSNSMPSSSPSPIPFISYHFLIMETASERPEYNFIMKQLTDQENFIK
jgi:hypothetical protein